MAAVAAAPRALSALDVTDMDPALARLVAATKRVSSEMLSGERTLFAGLCARAYDDFMAKTAPTQVDDPEVTLSR